ncbi:ankyrin repeat-containing domain protein [Trichoderma chlorosporum]
MASNGEYSAANISNCAISNSNIHQGNNHYHYPERPKSSVDCRDKLLLKDPFIDRKTLIIEKGKRTSGTCEWIKENEAYKSWLSGDTQCLWINGGPGKGKTMLSIFLTEELESSYSQDKLLFFFCTNGDNDRNNATAVLRGLAYQLLTKYSSLSKHISSYFESEKTTTNTLSSPVTLWMMFEKLLQAPELGTIFCVLDGLDECDEGSIEILVKHFRDLYSQTGHAGGITPKLKLAIVSRKVHGLDLFSQVRLDPDNDDHISDDIKQFVIASTQKLSHLSGFNDGVRKDIESALLNRSEGTFLWVSFVMYELLKSTTCTEAKDVLNALPQGLPAMYGRMLEKIKSSQRRIMSSILICVTLARQPMTLEELKKAASLLSNTQITDNQVMLDRIASSGPILQCHDGQVSLVHQSARDYLLREEVDDNPILEEFRVKEQKAHASLARICLDCIEKSDLRHRYLNIRDRNAPALQKSPLLHYAALHWPEHARRALYEDQGIDLSRPFFQMKSDVRKYWWKAYANISEKHPKVLLLHIASRLGIDALAWRVLTSKKWHFNFRKPVNQKDAYGRTALHLAAREGHKTTVQLLLASGADIQAKDKWGGTVLMSAAEQGSEAIVQLLLENGADISAGDTDGHAALHQAAGGGHSATVQLLLANGADVNSRTKSGDTALHSAAGARHEAASACTVQLLLANGADVNACTRDAEGRTALMNAAQWGHTAAVQLLLANGADVDIRDSRGETALNGPARNGHEATVRLLLANGADVDVGKCALGKTALMNAARWGHRAIVDLLLANGADVNIRDSRGATALIKAASNGHEAIARLLLANGADLDVVGHIGRYRESGTALSGAVEKSYTAIVQLLLANGADVNVRDSSGKTALEQASRFFGSKEDIVQLLLQYGAVPAATR